MNRFSRLAFFIFLPVALSAQKKSAEPVGPIKLAPVDVAASREDRLRPGTALLPAAAGVSAREAEETINLIDTEDAVKYLPSVFLRKRNYGDTQAVMATRVWGVSSSARALIFADGVPLSALIANNNSIGGPRWGLVAPAEIERIEVMYGPFSAAYAGNSMGAVMEITTRQPEKFSATLEQTLAWQDFHQYGTRNTYRTTQTSASVGDRRGKFSFWTSANFQDSHSQPLNYITSSAFPTSTTGGFAAQNKFGQTANVIGAGGLLHTQMANAKFKIGYDVTPTLRATYTFGFWQNEADATVETYLRNAAGQPTFAGLAGFASGYYTLSQRHSSHSLSLRSDPKRDWDFEASATLYRMDKDQQRTPLTASASGTGFGTAGRVAVLDGTGWSTLDLKATWQPGGKSGAHALAFGLHNDRYTLYNPTFNTPHWQSRDANYPSVATEGDGKTRTQALWAQETWLPNAALKIVAGVRYEEWRAYDGYNVNGATRVQQPEVSAAKFSPKLSGTWTVSPRWTIAASFGQAYRFATAGELYQLVSTGATFTAPNPNLQPDDVLATELKIERLLENGRVRLAFFQDEVHDAIISQFSPLVAGSPTLYSYVSNVDHVRARGVELVLEEDNVFTRGLSFSGSVTYLDAKTLATRGQGQFGSAIGKRLPNIPDWRASFVATYRAGQRWTATLGGRYSGMLFTTLDAADVNPNTWQGFAAWFVADAHVNCRLDRHWSLNIGADNLLNRKYFLFHPFPQRTWVASAKYAF
jgi:iron complex outermembrane receptor protein